MEKKCREPKKKLQSLYAYGKVVLANILMRLLSIFSHETPNGAMLKRNLKIDIGTFFKLWSKCKELIESCNIIV